MTLNTDTRWNDWLHAAKERAAALEQLAPLATYKPRRQRPIEAAYPDWYQAIEKPTPEKQSRFNPRNMKAVGNWSTLGHVNKPAESEAIDHAA